MNTSYILLVACLCSTHFSDIFATRPPLKKRVDTQLVVQEDNQITPEVPEQKIIKNAAYYTKTPVPRFFVYKEDEKRAINFLGATLAVEREVAARNQHKKNHPKLIDAIANNYDIYTITSTAETLSWQSLITGEFFSLVWHRWQYKMQNSITIEWKYLQRETCDITISTHSSSDTMDTKKYPHHCKITELLHKYDIIAVESPRIQAKTTGKCYWYGCEKEVKIRCSAALFMRLRKDAIKLERQKK